MSKIDRRDFIKRAMIAGGGLALGGGLVYGRRALATLLSQDQGTIDRAIRDHKLGQMSDAEAQAIVKAYMTGGSGQPMVIHVHDPDATSWDFGGSYYGDFVDQAVVDAMVDRGLMELTGTSTVADAWAALIPSYAPGEAIAIKVNFNNTSWNCDESALRIDALIHPVNSMVRGLKLRGVAETDIWVYDATRPIPNRFVNGCLYPDIQYFATYCRTLATYDSDDPDAVVRFSPPGGIPAPANQKITDVLVNATHLIDVPIIKKHGIGVTLAFKNHLGTINDPAALHDYLDPNAQYYSSDYNPMVEIYSNPHVRDKTRLVVTDGLFGNWRDNYSNPDPWTTFGGAPNSLFFAVDPVAIDCVMCDFIEAESSIKPGGDEYLQVAQTAGLGLYERGDPWGSGYSQIDYVLIEL